MLRAFIVAGLLLAPALTFAGKKPASLHLTQAWQVSLDAAGRVVELRPVGELAAAVRDPLERAIRGWAFEPGRADGKPAPTETTLTLDVSFLPGQDDEYSVRIDGARTGGRVDTESSRKAFPRFPNEAVRRGLFAMIVVKADYDASGRIIAVEPQPQYGINAMRALEKATVAAVGKWTVLPERVDGHAVASSLLLPVCYSVSAAGRAPPDYSCSFTPAGSESKVSEGGAFALAPAVRLRSDVIGRAL